MDQRGRPELRVPAIDRAAGGGVRRRDVLRDVQRGAATEDGRARVRRPRMPLDGDALCAELERTAGPPNTGGADAVASWVRSPCLGMCERAPAVLVQRAGGAEDDAFGHATATQVRSLLADATHEAEFARPNDPAVASAPQTWDADCPVRPAAAAARRRGGPELDRRLPGARRVRGASARSRARAGGDDPRDHRRQADGPRRRGVPDRGEVEGGRGAARAAALLHLQRRRIRARHVQGPGRDGAGSVRGRRGAHDRRVRHGMRARLHLHPRGVPAGDGPPGARDRRGAPARVPRATT